MEKPAAATLEDQLRPLIPKFRRWLLEQSGFREMRVLIEELFPSDVVEFTKALVDLLPHRELVRKQWREWQKREHHTSSIDPLEIRAFLRAITPHVPELIWERISASITDDQLVIVEAKEWYKLTWYLVYFLELLVPTQATTK